MFTRGDARGNHRDTFDTKHPIITSYLVKTGLPCRPWITPSAEKLVDYIPDRTGLVFHIGLVECGFWHTQEELDEIRKDGTIGYYGRSPPEDEMEVFDEKTLTFNIDAYCKLGTVDELVEIASKLSLTKNPRGQVEGPITVKPLYKTETTNHSEYRYFYLNEHGERVIEKLRDIVPRQRHKSYAEIVESLHLNWKECMNNHPLLSYTTDNDSHHNIVKVYKHTWTSNEKIHVADHVSVSVIFPDILPNFDTLSALAIMMRERIDDSQ